MAGMVLICFSCCMQEPAPKRRRIDRNMIGQPTDFRHTGHIGSGDVTNNHSHVDSLQNQMQSKGGYNQISPVNVQLSLIDVQPNGGMVAS